MFTSITAKYPIITTEQCPIIGPPLSVINVFKNNNLILLIIKQLSLQNIHYFSLSCRSIRVSIFHGNKTYIETRLFNAKFQWSLLTEAAKAGQNHIVENFTTEVAPKLTDREIHVGLKSILMEASRHGHLTIIRRCLESPLFQHILSMEVYEACLVAAQNGHESVYLELMRAPKFEKVTTLVLYAAIEQGHLGLVEGILASEYVTDSVIYPCNSLHPNGWVYMCVKERKTAIALSTLNSRYMKFITQEELQKCLLEALVSQQLSICTWIVFSEKFKFFDLPCLTCALGLVSLHGNLNVVNAIISHTEFNNIPEKKVGVAYLCAHANGFLDIEEALFHSGRVEGCFLNCIKNTILP